MRKVPIYFRFWIDDYLRDCEELSLTRHGAYLKLMLWYYSRAKPLPAGDLHRIYARVGAQSHEEKFATEWVLSEFFVLDSKAGVWRHKRIDEEIANFDRRTTAASESGKASGRARRELPKSKHELPKSMSSGGVPPHPIFNENNDGTATNVQRTFNERATNQNQNQKGGGLQGVGSISKGLGVDRSAQTEKIEPETRFDKSSNVKTKTPGNWRKSEALTMQVAKELGISPGGTESWESFRERIGARLYE